MLRKRRGFKVLDFPSSNLDFAFVEYLPEGFAAAFIKSNCEFSSLATLVFSSSHLPDFLRFANLFLALWTFGHNAHVYELLGVN